ncbi:MAG: carboxypeptidase regulatory-like domain-containing protein [Gemmatimonadaceae bacterium]
MRLIRLPRAALVILVPAFAGAQGKATGSAFAGVIRAATDSSVIDQAEIALSPGNQHATTGNDGRFRMPVERGTYVVRIRRVGFQPVSSSITVAAGETLEAIIFLDFAPEVLTPSVTRSSAVPANLSEFEQRRSGGQGRFISTLELASAHFSSLTDVLRAKLPGIQITKINDGSDRLVMISGRGRTDGALNRATGLRPCIIRFVMDGTLIERYDLADFATADIAGIELHDPATTPAQYRVGQDVGCGTLLVWSRRQ